MFRILKFSFIIALIFTILGTGQLLWWTFSPLNLTTPSVEISIEPGTSVKLIASEVVRSGVDMPPLGLYWLFRLSGQAKQIRAGSYELSRNDTGWDLLQKLIRGEENLRAITLIEGWNMRQFRAQLAKSDSLRHDSVNMTDQEIMAMLGAPELSAEGHFYPDTYTYGKGTSDKNILKRSFQAMQRHLNNIWQDRPVQSPLKTPEDALILASIIEKETGLPSDRPMIASVFSNRLELGMPLQTDPTVIYGLGSDFDGNLHKSDLRNDHPWNTYLHTGLPPTAIAMPGKASIMAAVRPAQSKALYFVAKGDGSSEFSRTLEEHNLAVQKFQLSRVKNYTSSPNLK